MGNTKSIGVAFLRTSVVPPLAGFLATWLLSKGVKIEATWVYSLCTIALSGIWYLTLHMVEVLTAKPKVQKWAGIFLGHPTMPVYQTNTMSN